MTHNGELDAIVRGRIDEAHKQIVNSLRCVSEGNPLAAEQDSIRLRDRLRTKAQLSREEAEAMTLGIRSFESLSSTKRAEVLEGRGREAIYGSTIDFVGIAFLERGLTAARAVARVAFRDGRPRGSGFLVSDRLFLTNHHVIETPASAAQFCIEFDYELDPQDRRRGVTRFVLDPERFFLSDDIRGLDYTLIAVGDKLEGPKSLQEFGSCALSDAIDKHALGEFANIVQHPDGRYKEVVLRENRLVSRLNFALHYVADTEPGSSGSPVFNNEWRVIALHHWGEPWRQQKDDTGHMIPREVNEGIRISAIVKDLRARSSTLPVMPRAMLQQVVRLGEAQETPLPGPGSHSFVENGPLARLDADGRVTWRVPLEISVRLPMLVSPMPSAPRVTEKDAVSLSPTGGLVGEAAVKPTSDYSDRSGYKPRFIEGFTVDLPRLTATQKKAAARNREAEPGDDPYELKYHHFSVVMNRERRLAFFTACNIDGTKAKHVDRKTGDVTPLLPDDPHLESLSLEEGAEASETWFDDPRLAPEDYAGRDIYEKQVVPGYPDSRSMSRTLRMFQRGHLVRRMDPAWGTERQARLADADTFHWTNCSPQVGFFNMGQAQKLNLPRTAGGKLWRAIENYVLRNAVVERLRVCSFTGPVFADDDREFRNIKVPGRFWKVVLWAEQGSLRSLAMLANQRPVIEVWPEALGEGAEAYGDPDELSKVQDFLTTVNRIEQLSGLDFGKVIQDADIRGGEATTRIRSFEDIKLSPTRRVESRSSRRR